MLGLSQSELDYIIQVIRSYPEIKEAFVFGSRAKGNYKNASDIDIALKGENLAAVALNVSGKLNDEGPLPYKVDVLDYNGIDNAALKDHIDRVGVRLYP